MSSEAFEPLESRPAVDAVVQHGQVPGQEANPPEAAEARLKAAVFSEPETEKQPPSLLGFAAAGMLLHDVLQDHRARPVDEDDDEEDKPKAPAE